MLSNHGNLWIPKLQEIKVEVDFVYIVTSSFYVVLMYFLCGFNVFYFLGYAIFCLFTYANLFFYSIFQLKQYISISK